jgi:hypothetical protein
MQLDATGIDFGSVAKQSNSSYAAAGEEQELNNSVTSCNRASRGERIIDNIGQTGMACLK